MNVRGARNLRIDIDTAADATRAAPVLHRAPSILSIASDVVADLIFRPIGLQIERRQTKARQGLEDVEDELSDCLRILGIAVVHIWRVAWQELLVQNDSPGRLESGCAVDVECDCIVASVFAKTGGVNGALASGLRTIWILDVVPERACL